MVYCGVEKTRKVVKNMNQNTNKTDYIPKLEDYNAPILLLMK